MAIDIFYVVQGGSHLKASELGSRKVDAFGTSSKLILQKKCNKVQANNKLSVRAEYSGSGNRNGGGDFAAGFIIGGALFGSLAYVFAPQIRRAILNEDEHGFRKPRKLYYEDEGVFEEQKTRETLNAKIGQLNSAIDKVASRLRGGSGKNNATPPYDTAPEIEFTV
ncbi:hypothetical protein LINGRAPRIM_LOCUS3159 [Linum grandiflorum]